MTEAPASFRKTLRGRLTERDGRATVELGPETLPDELRARLREGRIHRVLVTGQGTAAVAGQSLAATLEALTPDSPVRVEAVVATELSGFELAEDMSDTLVVAISQSGTTTDTNRTVDLVRSRGGAVVAIVNRRGSDLTDKADGVLYTSDGRDVEMSVASTKAFYAQVAAGVLLAAALAEELGAPDTGERTAMLAALRGLPDALDPGPRGPGAHRGDRPGAGPGAALLGRGRQRAQPHRRRRGPDQAVGALLQVDRL